MKIRHIKIERFRGIRKMEWRVGGDFVCLVGPGDSTKTTILDAVEFALSPRWNIPFDDSDFYNADTSAPIVITLTVGDRPTRWRPGTDPDPHPCRGGRPSGTIDQDGSTGKGVPPGYHRRLGAAPGGGVSRRFASADGGTAHE